MRAPWGWSPTTIGGVDERAVEALVREVEHAWNTHDMAHFAVLFAEDADFVNVRGWWWRGRPEIERNHALIHETIFSDSRMKLETAAIREVVPGVVVAHVRWRMVGHEVGGPRQTAEPRIGIWSWVIRDRGGKLEIVSSHNTDTMEMPASHPLAGARTPL
jgi:uncharacterized protein (TIGR02246 family)